MRLDDSEAGFSTWCRRPSLLQALLQKLHAVPRHHRIDGQHPHSTPAPNPSHPLRGHFHGPGLAREASLGCVRSRTVPATLPCPCLLPRQSRSCTSSYHSCKRTAAPSPIPCWDRRKSGRRLSADRWSRHLDLDEPQREPRLQASRRWSEHEIPRSVHRSGW